MSDRQTSLPDFDHLWDYPHPDRTERKFRDLLPAAEVSSDRDYHAQLLTQIARTQGLQRQFDAAHATLDTVHALRSATGAKTKVRYLLERGRVFNSSGQPETALPLFVLAWNEAREAGEDFFAIDAAHMIAIAEPSPDQQQEWNLRALALAEASPEERARKWLGSLYNNMGWTYHDTDRFSDALVMFEKAATWQEQFGQPDTLRIAKWSVAKTLRSLGRVGEALAIQRTLLRENEQANTPDGFVFEELGECLLLTGEVEKARLYFIEAYAELSQDPWLVENQPGHLKRLQELGKGASYEALNREI